MLSSAFFWVQRSLEGHYLFFFFLFVAT
jgi:hypothetical protein